MEYEKEEIISTEQQELLTESEKPKKGRANKKTLKRIIIFCAIGVAVVLLGVSVFSVIYRQSLNDDIVVQQELIAEKQSQINVIEEKLNSLDYEREGLLSQRAVLNLQYANEQIAFSGAYGSASGWAYGMDMALSYSLPKSYGSFYGEYKKNENQMISSAANMSAIENKIALIDSQLQDIQTQEESEQENIDILKQEVESAKSEIDSIEEKKSMFPFVVFAFADSWLKK